MPVRSIALSVLLTGINKCFRGLYEAADLMQARIYTRTASVSMLHLPGMLLVGASPVDDHAS